MTALNLSTWNVNSLRIRLPQVLDYLKTFDIDVLCLQELKMQNAEIPTEAFVEAGYGIFVNGQKTYNGVATIVKKETVPSVTSVVLDNPVFPEDVQKRLISVTLNAAGKEIRLVNGYFPNGESQDSEKFPYKLAWLQKLREFLKGQLTEYPNLVVVGDYNIAPEDRDVKNPEDWIGSVLTLPEVRGEFQQLLDLGFKDAFRLFDQPEKIYSWWDYRQMAFRRNYGARIDHILVSEALVPIVRSVVVDKIIRKNERPSDHAPVRMTLEI